MVTSLYSASLYDSAMLGAYAASSSLIYQRDVTNILDSSLETAGYLGTLTTDKTQLDVTGKLSKVNSAHYYKFTLDGDSLKLSFKNNTGTSDLRLQIVDSDGNVIADSSETASDTDSSVKVWKTTTTTDAETGISTTTSGRTALTLTEAYEAANSSEGLNLEAGEYYVRVSFDSMSLKSVDQTYSLGLYSGESFNVSYQTTGKSQTKYDQTITVDHTMTYSLIDALEYSTKSTHLASETASSAVNIGWMFANKTALAVSGQMTWVCDEQYYAFTLQNGEDLKMSFNNKTDTSELRVQLYDSTGTVLLADSHGTIEQQEAYEALLSSDGLEAEDGNYVLKVSYATGESKKDQLYSFNLYSGTVYDTVYETKSATETAATAILNGDLTEYASAKMVAASYLASSLGEDLDDIFSLINQYTGYI